MRKINFEFGKLFLINVIVLSLVLCLSACAGKNVKPTDPEAMKYLPLAEKFCAENNLEMESYAGKTIIRAKDYEEASGGKEPVVYEWKAANRASKEKLYIWVGPVLPMFPKMKPAVTLAKGRYTMGGKAEEAKESK